MAITATIGNQQSLNQALSTTLLCLQYQAYDANITLTASDDGNGNSNMTFWSLSNTTTDGDVQAVLAAHDATQQPLNVIDCWGRLTLTSGQPVTTSDVGNASTLYYTPIAPGAIQLESSITNDGLANDTVYDVFYDQNTGSITFGDAWGNTTSNITNGSGGNQPSRTTPLAFRSGRLFGTDQNIPWAGIIATDDNGNFNDTAACRTVLNGYNKAPRIMMSTDSNTETNDSGNYTQVGSVQLNFLCDSFNSVYLTGTAVCGGAANAGSLAVGNTTSTKAPTCVSAYINTDYNMSSMITIDAETPGHGYYSRFLISKNDSGSSMLFNNGGNVDAPATSLSGVLMA